jgi:hypothetical protein
MWFDHAHEELVTFKATPRKISGVLVSKAAHLAWESMTAGDVYVPTLALTAV